MHCSASLSALPCDTLAQRQRQRQPAMDFASHSSSPPLTQPLGHTPSLQMTSPRRQHCVARAGARRGAGTGSHCGALSKGSIGSFGRRGRVADWAAGGAAGAAASEPRRGLAALAPRAQTQVHATSEASPSTPLVFSSRRSVDEPENNVASVAAAEGPLELPPVDEYSGAPSVGEIEAEAASPVQTAVSVALTGALTVLLIRTFRRRAAKVKETRMRSSVVDRLTPPSEVDKAKAALKSASEAEPASPPPTALGALSGAVMAGAITYVAYSFTVGVDENFANQAISTNYAVRNITITVRTIISGLGWLATGVFGANTLGLTLLAFQIALGLGPDAQASAGGGTGAGAATGAEEEKSGETLTQESKEKTPK